MGEEQTGFRGGHGGGMPPLARRLEELRQPAMRFAFRVVGDLHEAEEAVQDAFVRLLGAAGQFRGDSSFRTYAFAAVRNCCLDRRRRRLTKSGRLREVQPQTTAFFRKLPAGSRFLGVSTQLQRRECQEIVRAAIDRLPERQRDCLILHDLEGFLYREVAEILDISTSHVGVLLYQGRIALRGLIEEGDIFDGD
ncbi:MAG: RNA polymerase sigma factor [Planctomycetota bacterium]|jgi:RNA polymerase sigma-70 factor (ECF subfamily)